MGKGVGEGGGDGSWGRGVEEAAAEGNILTLTLGDP